MKSARYEDRRLHLVGMARAKKLGDVGFIEPEGRKAIVKGKGTVEIFYPEREERRTVYYNRRVFLAEFAEFIESQPGA